MRICGIAPWRGDSDEEVLAWVRENGRDLSPIDIRIWNHFATKLGWKDDMTDREDIETIFDGDEGRPPRPHCLPLPAK